MTITREYILSVVSELMRSCPGDTVCLPDENRTVKLFEESPLAGVASADDEIFRDFKNSEAIGPQWLLPTEWLPGAKSVVSFFFPFSKELRAIERAYVMDGVSDAWRCGRVEGQEYLERLMDMLADALTEAGHKVCVPVIDPRFRLVKNIVPRGDEEDMHVVSAWSERHAAFACGLGTFGMSRVLITEKGAAGRIASIITDADIPVTQRPYTDLYEYCTRCGDCSRRCPVGAIPLNDVKNNLKCNSRINNKVRFLPCGKCQTCVSCEAHRPSRAGIKVGSL